MEGHASHRVPVDLVQVVVAHLFFDRGPGALDQFFGGDRVLGQVEERADVLLEGPPDLGVLVGTKTANGSATATTQTTTKLNQFNVKMPMGAAGEIRFTINKQTADKAGAASQDVSGTFMNYNHNLSKRTKVYVSIGSQRDELGTDAVTKVENRSALGLFHSF